MKKFIAPFLLSTLSACAILQVPDTQTTAIDSGKNSPICILIPADASFYGERYRGSGNEITSRIRDALRQINQPTFQISQLDSNAHATCVAKGAKRFLQTSILHYEDRATGFFGKPDRIELKLSLYSIDDPLDKRSVVYEAKTNLLLSAVLEWGNAKPTAMLGKDFEQTIWKLLNDNPVPQTHADSFGID